MKSAISLQIVLAVLAGAAMLASGRSAAAAAFENLDFESAVIDPPVNYEVPAADALPSWNASEGDPGMVWYDSMTGGAYSVSIHDGKVGGIFDFKPLQGGYSVMLQSDDGPPNGHAWISQVGDIPSAANSITFLSDTALPPTLLLNGTVIPVSIWATSPAINSGIHGAVDTYIGDIRAFSGQQNVELMFESATPNGNTLDHIKFSSAVVPEPSTLVLFAVGVFLLAIHRMRRR